MQVKLEPFQFHHQVLFLQRTRNLEEEQLSNPAREDRCDVGADI